MKLGLVTIVKLKLNPHDTLPLIGVVAKLPLDILKHQTRDYSAFPPYVS